MGFYEKYETSYDAQLMGLGISGKQAGMMEFELYHQIRGDFYSSVSDGGPSIEDVVANLHRRSIGWLGCKVQLRLVYSSPNENRHRLYEILLDPDNMADVDITPGEFGSCT